MALPSIGQTIRMQQLITDDEKADLVFKTRVADINRRYVTLELPFAEHSAVSMHLPVGTDFIVTYIDHNTTNYHFRTKLVAYTEDNIPLILISTPANDEIIKEQKRGFFRVDASLDVAVSCKRPDHSFHLITKTVDIGGGGISFTSPDENHFELGDQLQLWCVVHMKNNHFKRVTFEGEVVRVHPPDENHKNPIVSVKFVDIHENDNMVIMRYCFERQIELHKK